VKDLSGTEAKVKGDLTIMKGDTEMLAIVNGKIFTVTKGIIEEGVILIDGGKIKAVGKDVKVPEGAEVIDAKGKIITPGLIDSHSHLAVFGRGAAGNCASGRRARAGRGGSA
jgi:imidazolonepropionase-like amidohydrolase